MKRTLILWATLLMSMGVNALTSIEVKNADGVTICYDITNDGLEVTSGIYSGNIVIPEEVTYESRKWKVTSIGWKAFCGCRVTSVTIPNSVTTIGVSAFEYCSELTSVTIGNSVKNIRDNAFYNCSSLTTLTIPDSVVNIGEKAFSDCRGLTSITIGSRVTRIEKDAFFGCRALTSLHISDLRAWFRITFLNGSSNPLSYAHHLFLNGEEVKDLVIPNSVISIKDYAFEDCHSLTSVTIPDNVTTIGKWAFLNCSSLNSVTIPSSVTVIRESTFYGCSGLTTLTIPNSVTSIGQSAFRLCVGLTSVKIPNSVTTIEGYAFADCSSLTSLTIPKSVTTIGDFAFCWCKGLTSINIEAGNTKYDSRDDCNGIIETKTNTLITGCKNTIIPNSVTSIEKYAFARCNGLTSITIPNGVTSIGYCAFEGCSGLTSITIPGTVTSIGSNAFYGWNMFQIISKIENPFFLYEDVFTDITFANATLYVPEGTIDKYKAQSYWWKFKKFVEFDVNGDDPSDIGALLSEQLDNDYIYDLNGRRMPNTKLPKGVYIQNGKKVVIK